MAKQQVKSIVDIVLQLGVLGLMLAWCFQILGPFINPVLWGIIMAVALDPLYRWIDKRVKGRSKLSAIILTLVLVFAILVPSALIFKSAFHGIQDLKSLYDAGQLTIPPPAESVKDWPLVGEKLYDLWANASENLKALAIQYQDEILAFAKYLVKSLAGTGAGILGMLIALVIAGVLLATPKTRVTVEAIFSRLAGAFGLEFAKITEQTIQSVVKGVLGVAVIQSALIGLGIFLAGVPHAGLWTVLILIVAIVQLPATLLVIPILFYIYGESSTGMAVFWTVYFVLAGLSDNVLKPILLGKGAAVPMLVIFLGSIGGFMAFGFIGLFVGAIVLSLVYKLFLAWLHAADTPN